MVNEMHCRMVALLLLVEMCSGASVFGMEGKSCCWWAFRVLKIVFQGAHKWSQNEETIKMNC